MIQELHQILLDFVWESRNLRRMIGNISLMIYWDPLSYQYPKTVEVHCVQVIIIGAFLFLIVYANYLQTCDMQFGFKSNHSTVLCTAICIETINQYVNEGSNVYSCLLGASKAFDRVHWGRLFKILIDS